MKRFDDTNPGVLLKYYRPCRTLTRESIGNTSVEDFTEKIKLLWDIKGGTVRGRRGRFILLSDNTQHTLDRENSAQLLPTFLMALMRVNVRRANFATNPGFEVKKLPRFA